MLEIDDFYKLFNEFDEYITNVKTNEIKHNYFETYTKYKKFKLKYIFNSRIKSFKKDYTNLEIYVDYINEEYIKKEMAACKDLFSNINGYELDYEQKKAVITDENSNLVVAGAGSGKTLTIIGKIKYLIERKRIDPKDILCISFTNFTTDSLKKAIKKQSDYDIDVFTFHKLGCQIIKDNNIKVLIAEENKLLKIIDKFLKEEVFYNKELLKQLVLYFTYYIKIPTSLEETNYIDLDNDKIEDIKKTLDSKKETLQGELVSSNEELIIANYLYKNGINYKYEYPYPYDTENFQYKKYQPDFYLIDYDIYLEHFGISKDNNVKWLDELEGNNYLESIEWKRKIHKENNTRLVETYSYYFLEGTIFEQLDDIVNKNNIKIRPRSDKEIYQKLLEKETLNYFNDFKILLLTFINLFKSGNYDGNYFTKIKQIIESEKIKFIKERNSIFLKIVYNIYLNYQMSLEKNSELDFNDMINKATNIVNQYGLSKKYKYIIIDEYQDTSKTRYDLIKSIVDYSKAKLVAVGDDYQSIYRFTGCDLNIFLNFKKYFGYSKVLKLKNTYRNSQELLDVAGNFIMKNKRQLKKELFSSKTIYKPIQIYYYNKHEEFEFLLNEIKTNELFILGRNNKDINFLKYNSNFKFLGNKIIYLKNKKLNITFMTVHSSKGLESKEVVIINLENKPNGFPNKIINDSVLKYVLDSHDIYPFEEERRLFYVALTRTENSVYLFTPRINPSIFISEIIKQNKEYIEIISGKYHCPNCGNILIQKESKYGKFIGCKGFPSCTYKRKIIDSI